MIQFKDKDSFFTEYLEKKYLMRYKWAHYLAKRHFLGETKTTQRVEGFNSEMKTNVGSRSNLPEVWKYIIVDRQADELQKLKEKTLFSDSQSPEVPYAYLARTILNLVTPFVWNNIRKEFDLIGN